MKKILFLLLTLCSHAALCLSGQEHMDRFTAYIAWSEQLPATPSAEFLAFVQDDRPLSRKLRGKWLYQLARDHDWQTYNQYYRPSSDPSLVCLSVIAQYEIGETDKADEAAKALWLTGDTQPPICTQLFKKLLAGENFNENLITERIKLALEKRNLELALFLLKQYKKPRLGSVKTLQLITARPSSINLLNPGELQGDFYLYGLKRLVLSNMNQAIIIWNMPKTKLILNETQKQDFLAYITLFKAMRNHIDTPAWFKKIKPGHTNNALMEWQIRYALKTENWKEVERLILAYPEKNDPAWQYWLARSLEAQGQKEKATLLYETQSANRNYYGFLASARLNKKPSFQNEEPASNPAILTPYRPFLRMLQKLYQEEHRVEVSRLLNDFLSELPKEDASAVILWVSNQLQWHGQSIALSSNDTLNNQLALRFPLAYEESVKTHANKYHLPQAFVYAIIRQESTFRPDAKSSAGARGLMQLLPSTASMVAKREKIGYKQPDQLFITDKNINLGSAYLSQLYKRYNKHLVLIAAAYNAGPKQLNYWLINHPPKQMDIWIDTLPWQETRNYLKNVVAFYTVYQYRMHLHPDMKQIMRSL